MLFPEKKKNNSLDVTFFENQSLYPKTSLQGENLNEGNFWKLSLPSPVIFLDTPILENNIPIGSLDNESGQTQQQPEVYVYS